MSTHRRKSANRTVPKKSPNRTLPNRGRPEPTPEEDDLAQAAHVARLIERGVVKLGKGGGPIPELLEPGPRVPSTTRAVRWAKGR